MLSCEALHSASRLCPSTLCEYESASKGKVAKLNVVPHMSEEEEEEEENLGQSVVVDSLWSMVYELLLTYIVIDVKPCFDEWCECELGWVIVKFVFMHVTVRDYDGVRSDARNAVAIFHLGCSSSSHVCRLPWDEKKSKAAFSADKRKKRHLFFSLMTVAMSRRWFVFVNMRRSQNRTRRGRVQGTGSQSVS